MLTCKYLVYFILLFLVFSVDYLGVDDRNCNRRGRAHWRRPRRKAEAAEAGAEGKSFDSCFVFLIFAYLCYSLDFIIIFFVVAAHGLESAFMVVFLQLDWTSCAATQKVNLP